MFAQTNNQDSVALPVSVVDKIIDELILFDAAKVELIKKDSLILIYKRIDETKSAEIIQYKLNAQEYEKIITRLEELLAVEKATVKDLKRELRLIKIKTLLGTVGGIMLIIILL